MSVKAWIPRDSVFTGLQAIIGAIDSKASVMPTLAHCLIDSRAGFLRFFGTNLEVQLDCALPMPDCPTFRICCPARKLWDIIRALPNDSILDFEIGDSRLTLKCGRSRFVLQLLPAENFPLFEGAETGTVYGISCESMRLVLGKCAPAMASGDVRYYLNGIFLKFTRTHVEAAASNGHELASWRAPLMVETGHEREIIVPRRSVTELLRIIPTDQPEHAGINTRVTDRLMVCELPNGVRFSTKLVDGRFPDVGRVTPKAFDAELELDREAFLELVRRVSILANEATKGISFDLGAGVLVLKATNANEEEAIDAVEVDCPVKLAIAFDARYLNDALNSVNTSTIQIALNADGGSRFRAHADAPGYYIVMPLRL